MLDTQHADNAVKAAERRGLDVPDAVRTARDMMAAVIAAGHIPAPDRPPIPDSVAALTQAITDHAQDDARAAATRSASALFHDPVAQHYNTTVSALVPAWIDALNTEFTALVKTVRSAAGKLPADLHPERINWRDPKVSAPWQRAESAAMQLDQLVADRNAMTRILGTDGGRDNQLFAIAAFPDPTVEDVMAGRWLDELTWVLRGWRDQHAQPVSRWIMLTRATSLTLQLALPGQVRQRAGVVERWQDGSFAKRNASGLGGARAAVQQALVG